jgi:predicted double-glycine peptidase
MDHRFASEDGLLLDVHKMELTLRRRTYAEIRSHMRRHLTSPTPPKGMSVRTRRSGQLTVRYVRGEVVRAHIDPGFIFGGHDLVYDYVPDREIWIDIRQDSREIPFTLLHERTERALMSEGMTYASAHAEATKTELLARHRQLRRNGGGRHLKLRPFRQSEAFCGPASLKIVCSYFGLDYEEDYLAALCNSTRALGTDHSGLIEAAHHLGAWVYAGEEGTLEDLRSFTRRHRLPVIVGWYSPSNHRQTVFVPDRDEIEDHFSVVYGVTDRHVLLMDPETESGRRRIAIDRFLKLWWDTDGPDDRRCLRWFMALDFGQDI